MKLVTSEQMKNIEKKAMENLNIPSVILMENAAIGVSNRCMEYLEFKKSKKVVIFAGAGNNGGDGFAAARQLYTNNINITVIFTGDINKTTTDCRLNYDIALNIGINIININELSISDDIPVLVREADVVIDALIGTGLKNELKSCLKQLVNAININTKSNYVISVDCPTGINSDTGSINGACIRADETITFHYPKIGLFLYPASGFVGEIYISDISIPKNEEFDKDLCFNMLTENEAAKMMPLRNGDSNKGCFGKTIVFAGSENMTGAAVFVCTAIYKTGAGIVNACVVKRVAEVIQNLVPETVISLLPDKDGMLCSDSFEIIKDKLNNVNVISIGSGIGQSDETDKFIYNVLKTAEVSLIIDADALNSISKNISILNEVKSECIITPHIKEMSRLTGLTVEEIKNNPINTAVEFSKKYNVITVLKDSRTVITNQYGDVYINTTGNSSMAKGGTGDCLAGVISGLLSQGVNAYSSAVLGCYINGKAAEYASSNLSNYGVMARDILNSIPYVIKELKN